MSEFSALALLDRNDLVQLAELLEARLLTPPFGSLTLANHVASQHRGVVSECFETLARQGLTPSQVALVLRAFAAGRQTGTEASPTVTIVVSGPDAVSTARDTGVVMRELFAKARKRVLAVGFAVHQGKSVFEILAHRMDRDELRQATLCLDVRRQPGETSLDSRLILRFAQNFVENEWPGARMPRVYYDPRSLAPPGRTASAMHAKCVVIDGVEALVTSANFTEAAQTRNIELGVLVEDSLVARQIEDHFDTLIRDGHLAPLPLA